MNEQTCDKEPTQMFRRAYGANQNFIARSDDADIHSAGRQDKPLPQTFNQLVTPAQLECIDQGRNLGEHRKLRVRFSGSFQNQVFSDRVFSVPIKGARKILSLASPAHLESEACRRNQGHVTQESQGGAADPSQNDGSLESAVRPLNCNGWGLTRPVGIAWSKPHSDLWRRQWDRSQKTEPAHQSRSSFSYWKYVLNVLSVKAGSCMCLPRLYRLSQQWEEVMWLAPGSVCPTPHQALTTK